MRFDHVQLYAERSAVDIVERIRERIIATIVSAPSLEGYEGAALRKRIPFDVNDTFAKHASSLSSYLTDSWKAGSARASREMRGRTYPSSLSPDTLSFDEVMRSAFRKLRSSIISDVQTLLQRSALGGIDKDTALRRMNGLFKEYAARARGIMYHETEAVNAHAYAKRMVEISKEKVKKARLSTSERNKKRIEQGKHPLVIKVWRHSGLGNPPRENHVEMNGKGVPADMLFTLEGLDGETYYIPAPKAPTLPVSETAYCRCATAARTIFVTDEEESLIRETAKATGGYTDPRWTNRVF
jgi:hypothetical protein